MRTSNIAVCYHYRVLYTVHNDNCMCYAFIKLTVQAYLHRHYRRYVSRAFHDGVLTATASLGDRSFQLPCIAVGPPSQRRVQDHVSACSE